MAHFSQYRKNCHRTDVGNLQRSRIWSGEVINLACFVAIVLQMAGHVSNA